MAVTGWSLALRGLAFGRSAPLCQTLRGGGAVRQSTGRSTACDRSQPAPRPSHTGTVKWKQAPSPGSDTTQMRPPCTSVMRRHTDRPTPKPEVVADVWGRRTRSRKIRSCSSRGMPGPESQMLICSHWLVRCRIVRLT